MQLKPGVLIDKLTPQMVLGVIIILDTWKANETQDCVITAGNDGKHKSGSLHYSGNAVDIRSKNMTTDKARFIAILGKNLGENFDVLIEDLGIPNEHIHVEYQPKA